MLIRFVGHYMSIIPRQIVEKIAFFFFFITSTLYLVSFYSYSMCYSNIDSIRDLLLRGKKKNRLNRENQKKIAEKTEP